MGNWAIDKEGARRDLRVIQIRMPDLSRSEKPVDEFVTTFDLNTIDRLKEKPQTRLSVDSLARAGLLINEYRRKYDTTHVLTIYWNDSTHLQQIVCLLDTLKRVYNRFVIVANGTECMIPFYFPKPTNEFFDGNFGGCLVAVYPKPPTKTFQENFDMIFKDYIWIWILFAGLVTCVFLKI